ncbi:DUF3343 domain-containing protein [Pyramidobacter sp. SM-530-WT-4B]|uniref:DUF3343 domain-containing protein n=1 Tax=Pyramidobacter porci TaxID=2605789 RepID=A0A6L5Y8M9_9BACT|nr:DUF3343 domain-containing protein [Pyramidobacter porci]MCI6259615.1 DUF3343 domain-containing protein [Pyramidobacter sp.]MDY2648653.1 DUF3343 domain-containing protein [Pyramidobacter porci]MST54654.1 DUF3343 domain-containing protein [Pyramidobacter porci]
MKCLATFDVTSMALMFEKQCRSAGFDVRIIPVPRQISASCGLACSYPCDRENEIAQLCEKNNIEISETHHMTD